MLSLEHHKYHEPNVGLGFAYNGLISIKSNLVFLNKIEIHFFLSVEKLKCGDQERHSFLKVPQSHLFYYAIYQKGFRELLIL